MPVPVEAKDLAVGDYSTVGGTIKNVVEHRHPQSGALESVDIFWTNGQEELGVSPETLFDLVQGWGAHESSVRPGLAVDHEHDR